MSRICPTCSTEAAEGTAFCAKCGSKLAGDSPVTPAEKMRGAQAATAADKTNEQPLWRGGFSPKAMYGSWILAGVVTIAAAIASAVVPFPPTWLIAVAVVAVLW